MEAFQDRLKWEEEQNFVDHHFTSAMVRHVTGLDLTGAGYLYGFVPADEGVHSKAANRNINTITISVSGVIILLDDWKERHPDIPPIRR